MSADALDALTARYFRWACADWQRELAEGLPFLRRMPAELPGRLVALLERLEPEERGDLAAALVRRFHPEAVAALGEHTTQRQRDLLARWDAWRVSVVDLSPACLARPAKANVGPLRVALKARLSFLGSPESIDGASLWRYRTAVGTAVVVTVVDLTGRREALAYDHDLLGGDGAPRLRRASFLSWLGIGPSKWNVGEDGVEAAADLMAELCRRFLASVPRFLGDQS